MRSAVSVLHCSRNKTFLNCFTWLFDKFDYYDRDKSGLVEFGELVKIVASFNIPMTKDNIMKKFQVRAVWHRWYDIEWEVYGCVLARTIITKPFSQGLRDMFLNDKKPKAKFENILGRACSRTPPPPSRTITFACKILVPLSGNSCLHHCYRPML
jgi:hypothetical protein